MLCSFLSTAAPGKVLTMMLQSWRFYLYWLYRQFHNMKNLYYYLSGSTTAFKKIALFTAFFLPILACTAQELKIYSGCNFVAQGNVNVVLTNTAFKNDGTFAASTSTVSFRGDSDTTISYIDGTSNTRFYNLTLNKTLYGTAVKSSAGVKNILTVSGGYLYADSNLTLLSDVSNTARVAAITPGANVLGKVMVERYFPSRRAWRLLTAPVTNSSSIYNSWQNGGVYTAGRGMLVSGPSGTDGLDNTNATSLKTWDDVAQVLVPVTNTNVSISPTNNGTADNAGYFAFVRGDRNTNNFIIPNTNVTTLTGIGALQTGTQTFSVASSAGKYSLVGNPYASPVDFNSVTRSNVVKRFYVWDPTLNTLGGYVTLDDIDNDGTYSKSVSASAQTKEIQSSQAFFVETNSNGAASVTFTESSKSTTNNLSVFRPVSNPTTAIRVDLYLLETDNSRLLADGTLAEFNDAFDENVTNEDALKFGNINEGLAMYRNGMGLAIERRPLLLNSDTLFLKLAKTTRRSYQFMITPENMARPELIAYLEDTYLHTINVISLETSSTVDFVVDANTASSGANRFRIIFKPAGVLPLSLISLSAINIQGNIKLSWRTGNEAGISNYEIEKSIDGTQFNTVGNLNASGISFYSWLDTKAAYGNNFYRLKIKAADGTYKYSNIVKVTLEQQEHFTISPNPVKGKTVTLNFENTIGGIYNFNIMDAEGRLVCANRKMLSQGTGVITFDVSKILSSGVYTLQIQKPGGKSETQKIIINR
jgi:hypothetical protein